MPTYDTSISRDVSADPLVPTPVAQEIIKEMPKSSVILNNSRRVLMASQTLRQPVLSVLPSAYWVTGDTGLKQTGTADCQESGGERGKAGLDCLLYRSPSKHG